MRSHPGSPAVANALASPVSRLLKSRDVALQLGVSEATLSRWRAINTGPSFVNLQGNPRYLQGDIDAYIAANRKGLS